MTARLRGLVSRRGIVTAASAALALTVTAAVPADAQVFGVLTIEPAEGPVGTVVTGTVDPTVIPENCTASPEAFVEELAVEFDDFNNAADAFHDATWGGIENKPDPTTDAQSFGFDLLAGTLFGVAAIPDVGQQAWEQSFALTFADIGTQQPVGDLSSFDPETGAGEVTVPEVDPGAWAVAATCLHWNTEVTVDDIMASVAIATDFVEANLTAPYPVLGTPEFQGIAQGVGPSLLGNIFLLPGELWVSVFTVTGAAGPGPGPGQPPTAPPATPVPGRPDFTG